MLRMTVKHWRDTSVLIDIHSACGCCDTTGVEWTEFLTRFTDEERLPDRGDAVPLSVSVKLGDVDLDPVLAALLERRAVKLGEDGSHRAAGLLLHACAAGH